MMRSQRFNVVFYSRFDAQWVLQSIFTVNDRNDGAAVVETIQRSVIKEWQQVMLSNAVEEDRNERRGEGWDEVRSLRVRECSR